MRRPYLSAGASLASVQFESMQFDAAGRGNRVRSVVMLPGTMVPGTNDDGPDERRIVRQLRADLGPYDAVVLMPATRDVDESILWDCQEAVAPGEAFP